MADAPAGGPATKSPADFLQSIKGKPVVVKLNSGVDYRGALTHSPALTPREPALFLRGTSRRAPELTVLFALAAHAQGFWPAWTGT